MEIISKIEYPSFESDMPPECTNTLVRIVAGFDFDKIGSGTMGKRHGTTPLILYDYGIEYDFLLSGNLNTVSVNNITYTDVYRTSTDSNRITGSHIPLVPWQIEFSQSQGFLRFYLRNNITWTKVRNL